MSTVPDVSGGLLLECVGGPLDGGWVFLAGGDTTVNVGHYNDGRRTPRVGALLNDPDYLGCYVPRSFENGASCDWRLRAGGQP